MKLDISECNDGDEVTVTVTGYVRNMATGKAVYSQGVYFYNTMEVDDFSVVLPPITAGEFITYDNAVTTVDPKFVGLVTDDGYVVISSFDDTLVGQHKIVDTGTLRHLGFIPVDAKDVARILKKSKPHPSPNPKPNPSR